MALSPASVLLVLCALAALATASPVPEPKPFDLGKTLKQAANTVSHYAGNKADCLRKSGIAANMVKKALGCGPTALAGPELVYHAQTPDAPSAREVGSQFDTPSAVVVGSPSDSIREQHDSSSSRLPA
ncbi:Adenomatous polyposis coli protein-related protein 1 [Frankliniella fusca]|uniref:Adenomatous polyposis coli protein-related protein 1 n=1 Tax=Frankliniella fusca TaxID=407009 RepID=A0AAE1GZD3_9NEOP|nr:Adenomatous polyposis coli protein-related protein 1 [Frankliniella fusca]